MCGEVCVCGYVCGYVCVGVCVCVCVCVVMGCECVTNKIKRQLCNPADSGVVKFFKFQHESR